MTATAARPAAATSQSSLNSAVWQMPIHNYLRTVERWAAWLDDEGLSLDPDQVEAHHIDDFIVDIIEATSPGTAHHPAPRPPGLSRDLTAPIDSAPSPAGGRRWHSPGSRG